MVALLLLAAVVVILGGGIGTAVYVSEVRPRNYLEDWRRQMGYADTLVMTNSFVESKRVHITLEQGCSPAIPCNPHPAKDIVEWLSRGGVATMTEQEAAKCFGEGCQRVFYYEGHKLVVEFEKVSLTWNFRVQIDMYW
ncbi:hypothetical protein E1287_01590 [Actinomadura sp. KC06]|uniref:hypothetical protein n=1 Tax=Actinomadura sp. KC06 TaxID=2530369 RepID=UPI00104D2832|nr:hypothetical protein [Actinomadura sp. KC06]TDD40234.1 hypothetical protein E1287_01590 [Actinomadura sp. KC06]